VPYTADEKQWLKSHYCGEFYFLQLYKLSIDKEDDRKEGRAIVRGLMAGDAEDESDDQSDEEAEESDEEAEESEANLEGHLTDYLFDEKTLSWIEAHYGNSMNFLYSHGLKFYDDDDCANAKAIAHRMAMAD
jgi:hypothetical protein